MTNHRPHNDKNKGKDIYNNDINDMLFVFIIMTTYKN